MTQVLAENETHTLVRVENDFLTDLLHVREAMWDCRLCAIEARLAKNKDNHVRARKMKRESVKAWKEWMRRVDEYEAR